MSYDALERRSNQLARHLRGLGVLPNVIVALCIERSPEMLVALLGVLKAGGAYLALDPAYPVHRMETLIRRSKAPIFVTGAKTHAFNTASDIKCVMLDRDADLIAGLPDTALDRSAEAHDLACVIYPPAYESLRGEVMIEHHSVLQLFASTRSLISFGPSDVWTLYHSFACDLSIWQVFGALLHGGRLVIVSDDVRQDPWRFIELLEHEGVTIASHNPTEVYSLADVAAQRGKPAALRYVVVAGQALDVRRITGWLSTCGTGRPQLINLYGTAETTLWISLKNVSCLDQRDPHPSIGRPLGHVSAYILDELGNLVPPGVSGELYVSGAGLGRGYLGQKGLTEPFLKSSFSQNSPAIFKTGHQVRWLPNGDLEYLGHFGQ